MNHQGDREVEVAAPEPVASICYHSQEHQRREWEKVYQCQEVKRFNEAVTYYSRNHEEFCMHVSECLRSRLEWSDQEVIHDIISALAVQGWEKILEEENHLSSLVDW